MKDLSGKDSEVLTVFKEVFKQIGWGNEDIRLIEQASIPFESKICLAVAFQFEISPSEMMTTNKPFMRHFQNLLEKVRESELVRDELSSVEDKLTMANKEIDFLRNEIVKLAKYETHYNLEMKLRHGDKNEKG